jgi:hypothetical protein
MTRRQGGRGRHCRKCGRQRGKGDKGKRKVDTLVEIQNDRRTKKMRGEWTDEDERKYNTASNIYAGMTAMDLEDVSARQGKAPKRLLYKRIRAKRKLENLPEDRELAPYTDEEASRYNEEKLRASRERLVPNANKIRSLARSVQGGIRSLPAVAWNAAKAVPAYFWKRPIALLAAVGFTLTAGVAIWRFWPQFLILLEKLRWLMGESAAAGKIVVDNLSNSSAIHNEAASKALETVAPNATQAVINGTSYVEVNQDVIDQVYRDVWSQRYDWLQDLVKGNPQLVKDAANATANEILANSSSTSEPVVDIASRACSSFGSLEALPPHCQNAGFSSSITRLADVASRGLMYPWHVGKDIYDAMSGATTAAAATAASQSGQGLTQPNYAYPYMYTYGQDYLSGRI